MSADRIPTGRGAAEYVVSPDSPRHRSDALLLVTNTGDTFCQRKAYLRFDLVRDTCDPQGLLGDAIHAFAGNRHSSLPPPSLTVR